MTFSFAPISLGHKKTQDELDEALVGGQKKLDQDKDGDIDAKDFAMLRGKKKKKKNEDEPEGENGETADMNPKMATAKEDTDFSKTIDIVRKHSKGSEIRGSGDGTTVTAEHPKGQNATKDERMAHTNMLKDKLKHLKSVKVVHKTYPGSATEQNVKEYGMVYANKHKKGKMKADEGHMDKKKHPSYYENKKKEVSEKDENMSIRKKLISVIERANHGNMDSQETYDDMYHGAGAKKMRKDHQNMKVDTTRKLGVDDASKAGKATKKAPMRRADNAKGDTNIVPAGTPMKDPSASKDTALENVMAAYKSMNKE